ncbi:hypothetical protein [Falsarthrobacter nasiphocae]|uniref:Uncharacterized protein n=1 Tax=Falsarthrobacter nasiphocae TaxID=189863 RepID=A0AAE3YFP0_9MICC|nr:hypothetical protein [Falsarthrobacter nasiphocae]MDR6891304.1 hypothetical protein [Falsarthrobacter nasiphocae]
MIIATIVACEILFWVFLLGGLAARYWLRLKRLSVWILACAPLADLVLLAVTAIDMRRGATPGLTHALAAIYIGFSVSWGHRLIAKLDNAWAVKYAGAARAPKLYGRDETVRVFKDFGLVVAGAAVTSGLVWALERMALPGVDTSGLTQAYGWMQRAVVISLIIAATYLIWPNEAPEDKTGTPPT